MRIIDHTPFVSETGKINLLDQLKGTLQFGLSWYPDLQAQQAAIALLDKHLDKKFTLIRNHTLGKSKITIPMILVGPPGVLVLYVTHLRGLYRAKGDAWGTVEGGKFKPASINLLTRTTQLGRALQVYLKRQGYEKFQNVEPVLLSVDPGMHISSVRPIVRVVMSDAVERFATSLTQSPPVLSIEAVHEVVDVILKPRPPKPAEAPAQQAGGAQQTEPGARQETPSSEMGDISFAFEDEEPQTPPALQQAPPPAARRKAPASGFLGMSGKQLALLGVISAIEVCMLVGFIIFILLNT